MNEPAIFARLADARPAGDGWTARHPAHDNDRAGKRITVSIEHLDLLLSPVYDSNRLDHPLHRADLYKSGLTDAVIATQKFTDVPEVDDRQRSDALSQVT